MGVLDFHVEWKRNNDKTNALTLTDVEKATITKSTEIKNNICELVLKNSPTIIADDGSTIITDYIESDTKTLKFDEDDELRLWADYLTDASEVGTSWYDDDRLLGAFILEEFSFPLTANKTSIQLRAIDIAFLLFNKVYTFSYGVTNNFTAPGIVRHCARKFGEATNKTVTTTLGTHNDTGTSYAIDAQFVSEGGTIEDYRRIRTAVDPTKYSVDQSTQLDGALNNSATTITVDSTTGFEDSGTIVIDSEHISYTGTTATTFTGCTRGIDDTTAVSHLNNADVYQGFPLIFMSKIWKPLFEWIGEASQIENTNYLTETQSGGTTYFNRAFIFWVDKNNKPHWVYPDNQVDLTVTLGEEGRRSFRLEKSVFDSVNFVIYNAGEDMYGNGIIFYHYDDTSDVSSLKMRYQPMSKVVHTLVQEDLIENPTRDTSTSQDIFKQFPNSYPVTPSFLTDSNRFRTFQGSGSRANVTNDSEYNEALREAAKWRGLVEAKKITTKRSGLRYRGQIAIKGGHINPGDLISTTNSYHGLQAQKLRVINVQHSITSQTWETTLEVEEDEKTTT